MEDVEAAIRRCREASPPVEYSLGPDLSVMAEVYALLIFERKSLLDLATCSERERSLYEHWAEA
ncbi:DUF3717 domain-containing protein [Pandoraea sp. ISTKB]|uniref:DUF3717 domain-containing protein n=1 Tax=Pandoraea sp. ISTKB TaxID=1586708 RepID=UPI00352FC680